MPKKYSADRDNTGDFYSNKDTPSRIEPCKVYDKNGNLIKIISSREQLDVKWSELESDPLKNYLHPNFSKSRQERTKLNKRKQGQQINRRMEGMNITRKKPSS
jgi:hypothetical protein